MKQIISILLGLTIALLLGEVVTRIWLPVSPGTQRLAADGDSLPDWVEPATTYFQVAREFNSLTTLDFRGHRQLLGDDEPEVIFLGDSFTFGIGLNDQETMSYLYKNLNSYYTIRNDSPVYL